MFMLSFGGWVLCIHVGSDVVSNIRVLALAPALLASQYSVLCLCLCVCERENGVVRTVSNISQITCDHARTHGRKCVCVSVCVCVHARFCACLDRRRHVQEYNPCWAEMRGATGRDHQRGSCRLRSRPHRRHVRLRSWLRRKAWCNLAGRPWPGPCFTTDAFRRGEAAHRRVALVSSRRRSACCSDRFVGVRVAIDHISRAICCALSFCGMSLALLD